MYYDNQIVERHYLNSINELHHNNFCLSSMQIVVAVSMYSQDPDHSALYRTRSANFL